MSDISKREFFAVILLASRMAKDPTARGLFEAAVNDADFLIQTFSDMDDAKARKQRDENEKKRILKDIEAKKWVLKGLK